MELRPSWTAGHEELWQICRAGKPPVPSGDQTFEQAFKLAVDGFMYVCEFQGIEPPSEAVVEHRIRNEIDSR